MSNWDESEHPRKPSGTESGGEFTDGQIDAIVASAQKYAGLERVSGGGAKIPDINKMRAQLEKLGVNLAMFSKNVGLVQQRQMLVDWFKDHNLEILYK